MTPRRRQRARARGVSARVRGLRRSLKAWRLERRTCGTQAPLTDGNAVVVLPGGFETYAAIDALVAGATAAIAIEMYTWADDRIGRRLADAVAARARAGIACTVLLDAFGSFSSAAIERRLVEAGVRVLWYHPLAPWTPRWSPNRRNHRKLVVVDGSRAVLGGVNIAEDYTREFAGDAAWHDLALRVEGPAVRELARIFIASWIGAGGAPEDGAALIAAPGPAGEAEVQVLGGSGLPGRRRLRSGHLAQLRLAERRILVANAYFAPERALLVALCRAARRGVAVRILLPAKSDSALLRWAARGTYGRLLRAGAEIRELERTVLHAKVAVFDEDVLLAGSANLDYRSFRHNLEVAATVIDEAAARAALAAFDGDWEAARPVRLEEWSRRPWGQRVLERLARAVRWWL